MSKYYKAQDVDYAMRMKYAEEDNEGREKVISEICRLISDLPTIEVVRCEDCVWRDKDNQGDDYCTYAKGLADIGEESFCSWGNRIKK